MMMKNPHTKNIFNYFILKDRGIPRCKINYAELIEEKGLIIFKISANRFLRNMVRAIVGTLIEVGRKRISLKNFEKIIIEKNRSNAGFSAPAHGLFLTDIDYDWNKIK